MIYFKKTHSNAQLPRYMTTGSAGADLFADTSMTLEPGQTYAVPTGIAIDRVDKELLKKQSQIGIYPELQIRARSGLAYKHGIQLANGVGTIDYDYPDEIKVLLHNFSLSAFEITKGDRIAQIVLSFCAGIPGLQRQGVRQGGFGSTGVNQPSH